MEATKEYTDIIGGHGRFQLIILIFCIFCASAFVMHDFSITFFAPNIDYWCARPEQWDLVCDREWLVGMAKTVFMLGCVFGSVINGQLSDRVLPETPRWLLANGKFTELEELLLYAAKKNGKDSKKAKLEISDFIAYHSQVFIYCVLLVLIQFFSSISPNFSKRRAPIGGQETALFINSYNYYVLSWNTNDLGGDPYWNFFFIGAVGVPEVIIFIFLCRHIGNRKGLVIANVLSGVCLIVLVCIPVDKVWLTILFSVCGMFFSSGSFHTSYVYTPEISPTLIRSVALGSSSTIGRIGSLLSPFVHQLVRRSNVSVEEWRNFSLPIVKSRTGVEEYSHCTMYNISIHGGELHRNNIEIVQCDSWEYDHSHYKRTIVDQVEGEEHRNLAENGFGRQKCKREINKFSEPDEPTAAALISSSSDQTLVKPDYILGITDPTEVYEKKLLEKDTFIHFQETLKVNDEQRYEVTLPWLVGHPPLYNNREVATARLRSVTKRLLQEDTFNAYNEVFLNWQSEGIIEEAELSEMNNPTYYLPHRPVIQQTQCTQY
ncbi:unnamed protein product [Larinioides sclopetarius]|uniref:Major facilitator superfamily (MFS) profile domain-containing protein n=1 Tax=Larinioides sclopetarius TaxID=280406 RepID=A0AAV2AKG3_9ARAC